MTNTPTTANKPATKPATKPVVKAKSALVKAKLAVAKPKATAKPKAAVKAKVAAKPKAPVKPKVAAKPKAAVKAKPAFKPAAATAKASGGGAPAGGSSTQVGRTVNAPVNLKPAPAATSKDKVKKSKLVRDSFTMPETEYQVLGDVKKACLKEGIAVKKSELLRVGIALIRGLDVANLRKVLAQLPPLKAGRPKKEK